MISRPFPLSPALAALALAASAARAQAPAPAPPSDTVNVVLTVSGGISLGSYESGANWALVEFLRRSYHDSTFRARHSDRLHPLQPHRLAVATGASAGNINALLSALHWCAPADERIPAERSLFWTVWTKMGIAQLFPNDPRNRAVERRNPRDSTAAGPEYGIFRREFMQQVLYQNIRAAMDRAGTDDCDVALGVTLTKLAVDSIPLNDQIHPRAQRFASVFQLRTRERWGGRRLELAAAEDTVRRDRALGLMALPLSHADGRIETDAVLRVVEASSAFPLAFEPVTLTHQRVRRPPCDTEGTPPCTWVDSARFIDGGVFDNNPLDLGLRLYHDLRPPAGRDSAPERYVYIDPNGTRTAYAREPRAGSARPADDAGRGLSSISALLGGAVPAAREYELHALARSLTGDDRRGRITTTDRSHRLVSSHLGAFAGFLGLSFREYDFYVGMYDGLHFVTRDLVCGARGRPGPDAEACTRRELAALLADTTFGLSHTAQAMLQNLYAEEFTHPRGPRVPADTFSTAVLLAIDGALDATRDTTACATRNTVTRALCRDGFVRFLHALNDSLSANRRCHSRAACVKDPEMRKLLDDPERYLARLASRVIDRMDNVERGLRHGGNHRGVVLAGALYHMGAGEPRRGIEKDPSSVPDTRGTWWRTTAHALPYYVGFGTNTRMLETGFRPGYYFRRGSAIVVPLLPLHLAKARAGGGRRAYLGYGGGLHVDAPGPLDVEASYQQLRPWGHLRKAAPVNSVDGAVIFGEKLRLGVRVITSDRSRLYTRRTAISLGILDFNGLVYWAGRIAH